MSDLYIELLVKKKKTSTDTLLKVLMIGVFPLVYLGIGICVVIRRRRMQHETV